MAYEKHTWETGEVVSADKLNHIEDCLVDHDTNKQDKLTAGENITISADNVISATGGGGSQFITISTETGTLTTEELATLQASKDNYIVFEYTLSDAQGSAKLNFLASTPTFISYSGTGSSGINADVYGIMIDISTRAYTVVQTPLQGKLQTDGTNVSIDEETNTITVTKPKNWYEANLSVEDYTSINEGEQFMGILTEPYIGETFKDDYFVANFDRTGQSEGGNFTVGDPLQKIYVDVDEFEKMVKIMVNCWNNCMNADSQIYNNYNTIVWSANVNTDKGYSHEGSLEDPNVVYVQDVSQQPWQGNGVTPKGDKELEPTAYGYAYVLAIRGDNGANKNLLFCCRSSQAAYRDRASGKIEWADLTQGKVYTVSFDTDASLWVLDYVDTSDPKKVTGVEITEAEKAVLLSTGIAFTDGSVAASRLLDTTTLFNYPCFGAKAVELVSMISYNIPFDEPTSHHVMTFFGRPVGFILDSYKYWDSQEEQYIYETAGCYTWLIPLGNMDVGIRIPKSNPTRYIIERIYTNDTENTALWRHTFSISTGRPITELDPGRFMVDLSFGAVNTQEGKDANVLDYIMFSDMNIGAEYNWVLPASGVVGIVTEDHTVSAWYPIFRILAGWIKDGENTVRALYVEYFADGIARTTAVITPSNMNDYIASDFKSSIGNFVSPKLAGDFDIAS